MTLNYICTQCGFEWHGSDNETRPCPMCEQDKLLDLLNRFRSEVRMYCRPSMVKHDVFPVFKEVDDLFKNKSL